MSKKYKSIIKSNYKLTILIKIIYIKALPCKYSNLYYKL